MQFLAVAAPLHRLHHDVFRGQEGQIFPDGPVHDLLVDVQPVGHVLAQPQHRIGAEEALRQGNAAVGGVVQRPFQPLNGGGHGGVGGVGHQIAAEGADPLGTHGVPFVGHGAGADLILLKRLFHLTVMLQEPEVVGHAVGALGDGGQHIQNPAVGFPGIGLAADGEAALKAEGGGDPAVHLVDFRPVALKEIHEAGLGAGSSPAA